MFEQEQANRLDTWLKIAEDFALELPNEKNALRLLDDLDRSLEKVDRSVTQMFEEEKAIANTLNQIKHSLKEAIVQVADTEKYTKTARMLADREKKLVADMLVHQLNDVRFSLQSLSAENRVNRLSLEKRSIRVTQELRDQCQNFLRELGYICFSCENHEAEAMCAHLGKAGRTSATISEDLDTLVFGDKPLIRYFFSRRHSILVIDPVIARKQLQLSKKSFVDFCILSGTDFSGTISGIGPVRALEYIQKYKTIENLLPDLHTINSKYVVQSSLDYKLARRVRYTHT
ncbi:unnamed protein product [Rhizopus stolonifer]